jgi:hypothetical protein
LGRQFHRTIISTAGLLTALIMPVHAKFAKGANLSLLQHIEDLHDNIVRHSGVHGSDRVTRPGQRGKRRRWCRAIIGITARWRHK